MRSVLVLQDLLERSLIGIHSRRRESIWRAVAGLVLGGRLWLTALGRSLPGNTSDKHRIKAVDRLLGKDAVHRQLPVFYRALAARLLKLTRRPVVIVDWTGLDAGHYLLSAQLCCDGRSMPLYNRVFPKRRLGNRAAQQQFLLELAAILPHGSKPIVVTDAGFRSPWFNAVASLGWDYVGRIRNKTNVYHHETWIPVKRLHQLAGSHARDLGWLWLPRTNTRQYRVVLSSRPILKGRKRKTRRGGTGHNTVDVKASRGAREPWVLITSLSCRAQAVVRTYKLRMQIEQSFRDTKNFRHGWALHHARSKSEKRLEVLLLIAALAFVALQLVGRAATYCGAQRLFQANTITHRRVLSFFVLGKHVLRSRIALPTFTFARAVDDIVATIALRSWFLAE